MADKKISALTASATPLAGTEVLPIVQSGATVKVAVSDLTAGRAVSASSLTASTDNIIIGTTAKGITTGSAIPLGFGVNNTVTAMTIDTSSDVAIGASAVISSARLTVNRDTNVRFNLASDTVERFGVYADATLAAVYAGTGIPLTFTTGGSERARIDTIGNVGVGTTTPVDFSIYGYGPTVEARGGRGGSFVTSSSDAAVRGVFAVDNTISVLNIKTVTNHPIVFGVNDVAYWRLNTSGNLAPSVAGNGIDFSANANAPGMTSELLNWYEEGTWTPAFAAWTTAPSIIFATYTKIGRQVTVTLYANDGVNAGGQDITGLPFTSNASSAGAAFGSSSTITTVIRGSITQSSTTISNFPTNNLTGQFWQIVAVYFA